MRKLSMFVLLILLLMTLSPFIDTNTVDALTLNYSSNSDLDGFIFSSNPVYADALTTPSSLSNSSTYMNIGQEYDVLSTFFVIRKGYLSFETSSIVGTIQLATLNCKVKNFDSVAFDLEVNNIDYGTLDKDDWNTTGNYEGILLNTASISSDTWYSLPLTISNLNLTGYSQYILNSSRIGIQPTTSETVGIYTGDSPGNEPYLTVISESPGGMLTTYNFTQTGMTNSSQVIYPVEILSHNATWEQLRYEVYSHNETWLNISVDANYSYQSIAPFCSITSYGGGIYNITNTWDNTYYHIWFLREKSQVQSLLHIAMADASKGEGIFWEKWQVSISPGLTYDNTSANRITNSDYRVTYGNNYTIAVMDWFTPPNIITTYSLVASALEMDIKIDVESYPITIYNDKDVFTEYRVYYNGTIYADPYNEFIIPGGGVTLYTRTGTFMFVFQFYEALGNFSLAPTNAYFFNYTIDGAYGIHITGTNIATVISQMDGLEQTFDQFNMALISPTFWAMENLPVAPVEGTKSMTEPSYQNAVLLHPYAIMEADIQNPLTGTSGDFYDPSPSAGTTTILEDELYISGNYSTNLMLNLSNGWNFLNLTTLPGLLDLTAYNDTSNITFWANDSISIVRKTTIRNSGLFYWAYYPTTGLFITTQSLNNTTDFDWTNIHYILGFVPPEELPEALKDSVPDLSLTEDMVYDIENQVYLVLGQHFLLNIGAISMDFDMLNSSISRSFTYRYFMDNGTNVNTEIMTINPPYYIADWNSGNYYKGSGSWNNPYSSAFTGDIHIKIVDAGGVIDQDSVWVKDVTNDRLLDKDGIDYTFSGNTVMINYKAIPDIQQGGSIQYEVYYLLAELDEDDTAWLFRNKPGGWPASPIVTSLGIGVLLMILGAVMWGVQKKDKEGGFILTVGLTIFLISAILSMMHYF